MTQNLLPAAGTRGTETQSDTAALPGRARFLEASLSSIPDLIYAFDRERRFAYANPAMLALFGLSSEEMLGKTFDDLDYPPDLARLLNEHIDRVLEQDATVEDEVFFRDRTGEAHYFSYHWGPLHGEDGSPELVVGVSRDTTERRAFEEALRKSEARLRAATELVGVGIYSWDPQTGALHWDDRLRAMWGLPPGAPVDMHVYEAGIHPEDLPRVRDAIARCADPAGDGRYNIEYRVIGRDDGVTRHIATAGQTSFADDRAVGFIGAAIDVTAQRHNESRLRASEAQFRSFAEHSSNLIWMGDPAAEEVLYRSPAYERIWGVPPSEAPTGFRKWMEVVHPEDRQHVERALAAVMAGEVTQVEYRIVRSSDGALRSLRDTSFPIVDENGAVTLIGGITEDLTIEDVRQAYVVCGRAGEARRLAGIARVEGYRTRIFSSASSFLDVAPVLAAGCVLVDLRNLGQDGLSIPRELKARSIMLPTIVINAPGSDVSAAVSALKAGAADYVIVADEPSAKAALASAMAECLGAVRPITLDATATARIERLTRREREVLIGLVEGGTNKSIAQKLGISPRTVELHRAQVMNRLNASTLTELLQIALAAGITRSAPDAAAKREPT